MTTDEARAATERICQFFETLAPQSLAQIGAHYTPEARFKDPFNEVQGHAAIRRIFEHMFTSLHEPRFVVTQRIVDGAQVFLVWEFRFRFQRFDTVTAQVIEYVERQARHPSAIAMFEATMEALIALVARQRSFINHLFGDVISIAALNKPSFFMARQASHRQTHTKLDGSTFFQSCQTVFVEVD